LGFSVFQRVLQNSLGKVLCCLVAAAAGASAHGGPLDELRLHSKLPPIDLARLKGGEIVATHGPFGSFKRGIYLESCYFIHAPMDAVGPALLHWNPLKRKNPEVRLYREFSLPASADVFKTLQLNSGVSDDRWLLGHTIEVLQGYQTGDLHLTEEEAAYLRRKPMTPSAAWQEILRRRSDALARGGLSAVAPYVSIEGISPGSEFRGLLTLAPKIARHFQLIIGAKPIISTGEPASEAVGYWEATKVRDHTTLQLGLFAARKGSDSWQLIDCVYYPSDTYFMALDLFQLWPVDGGTLVWQVGFVSAPFRTYLGGVDRFVAGKQMMQETLDIINAFRADVEKHR
jgi:hypothetical protein